MDLNADYEADESIELGKRIFHLLPPPDMPQEPSAVAVTLALSEQSLVWFKEEGKRHDMPYQQMIRNLVDEYVRYMKYDEDGEPPASA